MTTFSEGRPLPELSGGSAGRPQEAIGIERLAMKTLTEVTDCPELLSRIETFFEDSDDVERRPLVMLTRSTPPGNSSTGLHARKRYDAIVGLLKTKKNIIMQGHLVWEKTYAAKLPRPTR